MMVNLLKWLERHRLINILLTLAFFLVVVVFHDEVTQLALKLRRSMTVESYNLLFTAAAALSFGVWGGWLWARIKRSGDHRAILLSLLPTVALIVIFFLFMQTYAIEAVHFFQYAILAILLFPLIKSYGATVYWATFLGLLDEVYQYVVLTPAFNYFDFNDVLLNLLGAALAAITIYLVTGERYPGKQLRRSKRWVIYFTLALVLTFIILYLFNFIRWYPAPGEDIPRWFSINRTPPLSSFWTAAYSGKILHIIRPWEGIALMLVFMGYYFQLDSLSSRLFPAKKIS